MRDAENIKTYSSRKNEEALEASKAGLQASNASGNNAELNMKKGHQASAGGKQGARVIAGYKIPQGIIYTIQPRQRGKIKKERVAESFRNIHTLTSHSTKHQKQRESATPELDSDIYSSDFITPEHVQPVQSIPKGIPMTFLHRQQNIGALVPQTELLVQDVTQPAMSYSNENQYNIMANAFAQGHPSSQYPYNPTGHMLVHVDNTNVPQEQYSPTDVYKDVNEESHQGSESPDILESKQKRLSAFQRLGPQAQPKKPKLTINLCLNKDQEKRENQQVLFSDREVIESVKYIPVCEREEVLNSTDATVTKYRALWPWRTNPIPLKRSVTCRSSKTVMMMEKEQIEEEYNNNIAFIIVSVKGYPRSWTKENLLDTLLENVKAASLIPCFIEFTTDECRFLVNRCRPALLALHYLGFSIRKGDVELMVTISVTLLNTKQLGFIPRLVLRNRLDMCFDREGKADLREFTLASDVSHFIYFPLNRLSNQRELMELLQNKDWNSLQELDLSHNRLTSIEGFDLLSNTPHLQYLDLSHNSLDTIKALLPCRGVMVRSLGLEGNPLCLNYVDADYYIKVARTIFPRLRELDGVPIKLKGDMPKFKQNYCQEEAKPVVEKFLEVFFRLLDREPDERNDMVNMYHKDAVLSITCKRKLRYDPNYKEIRSLLLRISCLEDRYMDTIEGTDKIVKLFKKWPKIQHDPSSFTVDVMHHDASTTILKVGGLLKLISTSLAEDEHLIAFTRTVLLEKNDVEYRICNEMLYWDEPTKEYARSAFKKALVENKVNLKFDNPLDDETKESLIEIFMKLTELEWKASKRCLEEKDWDIRNALDYFMKLLKLDNIAFLKL